MKPACPASRSGRGRTGEDARMEQTKVIRRGMVSLSCHENRHLGLCCVAILVMDEELLCDEYAV